MFVRAFTVLAWSVAWVVAHPHCWIDQRAVDLDGGLDFCSTNDDAAYGVCCTDAEEEALSEGVEVVAASLTENCAAYYKEVECAICGSYSGHLHERLHGLLTMTISFCESFTSACAGQIEFEADYCAIRTGDEDGDLFWSYPYTSAELFEPGFTEVFPDLADDDEIPEIILAVHQSPDGGMYWLAGKEGMLKQVDADALSSSSTVMDLSGGIFYDGSTEEGFLDFAFSPMFETNGYFYASYNVNDTVVRNRLSKFVYTEGDPVTTRDSEEVLLESDERPEYLHNGGWVGFKPSVYGTTADFHDLYWTVGDGGPQGDPYDHAQSIDTIFGSVVRISVPSNGTAYGVPTDNYPGGLPEICAIGFRSHWRCSFDSATDDLYCGDVGYAKVESIYKVECGNNYGWVQFEGSRCTEYSQNIYGPCLDAERSYMTPPIFEYCHYNYDSDAEGEEEYTGGTDICGDRTVEGNSVIGGYRYRGEAYADLIPGAYVFADYVVRNIYYIMEQPDGTWTPGTIISDSSVQVVSFAETTQGELLVIDTLNNVYFLPCSDLCLSEATPSPIHSSSSLEPATGTETSSATDVEYTYLGCFDDAETRVLTGTLSADSSMTTQRPQASLIQCTTSSNTTDGLHITCEQPVQACADICQGFAYFGTEYGVECFCGLRTDDPERLGPGTCATPCAGDTAQTCGGGWAISIYEYTSGTSPSPIQTPFPVGPTTVTKTWSGNDAEYNYIGCFGDSPTRVFTGVSFLGQSAMTTEVCAELCQGSKYFGTEYGNECFCGQSTDDPDSLGSGTCYFSCAGDATQNCGGVWSLCVYQFTTS